MGLPQLTRRELEAAGIADPGLRASYARCKQLNALHGRTYYLATLLLPPRKRPYVHALYGFARHADNIVDDPQGGDPADDLATLHARFDTDARSGSSADPIVAAVVDTIHRWDIPLDHFDAFLESMRMDLTVSEYKTFDDLLAYMYGSAAVIGLQMLPILEPLSASAAAYAQDLGIAFQLTNFIRDVGEDLRLGRLYLPLEDLDRFDLVPADLLVVDSRVRRLLAFEISRARELFRSAEPGIRLLHPSSRDCIRTALVLYRAILDEVERADYRVLDRRVAVSRTKRLKTAIPGYVRAIRARGRR